MGGYGSTRWTWERTRRDTVGLLRLDVNSLKRAGALRPGAVSTTCWTRGDGEPVGNIVTRMDRYGDRLTLDYRMRVYGETEWTPHEVHVWLDATPCHYGGERVWFRCPHCQSRRAVLYVAGGIFGCRSCHNLAYTSTREDVRERSIRRCQAIQKRLGGGGYGVPIWTIPPRPARMHWTTYRRLVLEMLHELHKQNGLFDVWLAKREARLRQLL